MASTAIKIPGSLHSNQFTSVPFFFKLTFGFTSKWKEILRTDIPDSVSYLLPPPAQGINTTTQTQNSNEMQFWQLSTGDKGKVSGIQNVIYTIQNSLPEWAPFSSRDSNLSLYGGKYIPKDLSRIQYKGSKKRGYQFGFELWTYNDTDAEDMRKFNRTMHAAAMTHTSSNTTYPFRIPPLFKFDIVDASLSSNVSGDIITNNYFVDPQPCTLVAFNSSPLTETPVVGKDKKSGRMIVHMTLLEIEPTAWRGSFIDGNVVPQFSADTCTPI